MSGPAGAALARAVQDCRRQPEIGRGTARIPGGPQGEVAEACAISVAWQIALRDGCSPPGQPGDLAHEVRQWLGIGSGDPISLADAWWIVATRTYGARPQPWILLLVTTPGEDAIPENHINVINGPGQWNGKMAMALGNGLHFDPVWWHPTAATIPTTLVDFFKSRAAFLLDAGAAAAVLMASGFLPRLRVRLNRQDRPSEFTRAAFMGLTEVAARAASQEHHNHLLDPAWTSSVLILDCGLPLAQDVHTLAGLNVSNMINGGISCGVGPPAWAVLIDDRFLWLAQSNARTSMVVIEAAACRLLT